MIGTKILEDTLAMIHEKGEDYAAGGMIPESVYPYPVHMSVLNRITDKIYRIKNLVDRPSTEIKFESVSDNLKDIIGYCVLLDNILKDRESQKTSSSPV